ncbi:hypothetical protein OsI_02418 [Oryza sativa Indica Group]|jgi:hypothetical protein|uniref:Uncharacterized protein n=1 Tax=Oryza sativa subsp. indica TaxID=39946 RepID=B8AAC4_ORYSI|nr:hypothetical protein OsI_02418 [Oryza sativa Indica Group]
MWPDPAVPAQPSPPDRDEEAADARWGGGRTLDAPDLEERRDGEKRGMKKGRGRGREAPAPPAPPSLVAATRAERDWGAPRTQAVASVSPKASGTGVTGGGKAHVI